MGRDLVCWRCDGPADAERHADWVDRAHRRGMARVPRPVCDECVLVLLTEALRDDDAWQTGGRDGQ